MDHTLQMLRALPHLAVVPLVIVYTFATSEGIRFLAQNGRDMLRIFDYEFARASERGTQSEASSNLQQIESEHREILTAVQAGDAEKARILMIAHQARTRDLRIAAMARR
ncbi:FCD domain-containing protein [Rhodococcus koreensis]|uniref:FCD domain-containing protein n=1 Tax=Rhodococcus koreensis TaxID=99653 RepID=UPI0009352E50|nr:FCD domain-containing protein [Rhodococcus koreensis]